MIVVKSIDRLGRNHEEIQDEWHYIVKELRADIVILDMPILDTRTNKDLIGTLISDIVLQLLSYVAGRARKHPSAAGRGHRCGKSTGKTSGTGSKIPAR